MAKHLHFVGIGGVGMAGLAYLLHKAGFIVSGCDGHASKRTEWLAANGIPVAVGHSPSHLETAFFPGMQPPDELIVTPAVRPEEPELACSLPVHRRGEILAATFNNARIGVAVCGTHGKTTTSTFTTRLLQELGARPSWCIGGETGAMQVAGAGDDEAPFVVEADESDGTLALYHASILVIMNMDWDHPDHFHDEASYRACYDAAAANAHQVIRAWELPTDDFPEIVPLVNGQHNAVNARAAVEVALRLGYDRNAIASALPAALAALPDRRFQQIYPDRRQTDKSSEHPPFRVVTDYAHHPRELACAVSMARALNPRRLRVLFQPHRYSRTRALLNDFPDAFAEADEVILIPVYAAFEQPMPGGDIADLYCAFRGKSSRIVRLARSADEAWRHVLTTRQDGDLVLIAGAGDVIGLVPQIERDLAPCAPMPQTRKIFIGAGSNTWKSDLATGEEYVATDGPAGRSGASLGIPWMAGIPGTIGGWVKMNAGAFGHSISEVIRRVKANGRWLDASECGFGYRTSSIEGEITDVEFDFAAAGLAELERDAHAYVDECAGYLSRRRRFPAGTKGSVFKNPSPELPAGRLLEEAGCKGMKVGGAEVWNEHANVIVSSPQATASDFLALARLMAHAVYFKSGIRLEPEVRGIENSMFN